MHKNILSMFAVALVYAAGSSAMADQVVSSSTLDAMGLSGLVVMSDSDAMTVRGMGYSGGHSSGNYSKKVKTRAKATGESWAVVEFEGETKEAEAGSENSYDAKGRYKASGENGSEAELEKTNIETLENGDGAYSIITKFKVKVSAGGYSSAKAF
jgi:hypothetical protein